MLLSPPPPTSSNAPSPFLPLTHHPSLSPSVTLSRTSLSLAELHASPNLPSLGVLAALQSSRNAPGVELTSHLLTLPVAPSWLALSLLRPSRPGPLHASLN